MIALKRDSAFLYSRPTSQRQWNQFVCERRYSELLSGLQGADRAVLLVARVPLSGSWLRALPDPCLGLCLKSSEVRITVCLRFECLVVRSHTYLCGESVTSLDHHGLSCRRCTGKIFYYFSINAIIAQPLRSVDIHTKLEPSGLIGSHLRWPDGTTVVPWALGRCLTLHFTCPDTLNPSHHTNF